MFSFVSCSSDCFTCLENAPKYSEIKVCDLDIIRKLVTC